MNRDKNTAKLRITNDSHGTNHRVSNNKKEAKIESKLKCGDIGIDCIIKYK